MAAIVVEAVAVCAFVIAVYEVVVGGAIALWPHASDNWILPFWIAAAAIAGSGMAAVRSRARALIRRVLPASGRYHTLMSSISAVVAAGPVEDRLPRLAELLAAGTGAPNAVVGLGGPARRRAGRGGGGEGGGA